MRVTVIVVCPPFSLTLYEAALNASVPGVASSLRIVPVPCALVIVTATGFERLTKKVSFGSTCVSPLTKTVIGFEVSLGAKLNVPLAG